MSSSVCLRVSFFGQGGKSENTANLKVYNYITPSQAYNSQLANMQIGLLSSAVKMSQNYCFSPPKTYTMFSISLLIKKNDRHRPPLGI